jgi:hypothetical protein
MIKEQHTKLHTKCLRILDLMDRADRNLFEAKWRLHQYDKAGEFENIKLFTKRHELLSDVETKKAVSDRLISYYASQMIKLIQPAAKKAFFHHINN